MKRLLPLFLGLLIFSGVKAQTENFRNVGYFPSYRWSMVDNFDYTKVTCIDAAFANPVNAQGKLGFEQNLGPLVSHAHQNDASVLISLGGGAISSEVFAYYLDLLQDGKRSAFIDSIVYFVNINQLDGVDIDLEGNMLDIQEYGDFVYELADTLHQCGKIITAALASWNGYKVPEFALDQFDFINLMAYDATGPWDPGNPGPHSPYSMAVSDINYWKNSRNVPAEKIVLGVPFYGYEFVNASTVNALTYAQIVKQNPEAAWTDQWDNIYYNGIPTIEKKTGLAMEDAGGIMIWELGQDASGELSLLNAIHQRLNGPTAVEQPLMVNKIDIFPSPFDEEINIKFHQDFSGPLSIDLFDLQGRAVQKIFKTGISANETLVMPIDKALTSGIYLCHIESRSFSYVYKLVKK